MPAESDPGSVVLRVRGRVSAADHVYAHDRVAQLGRLVPDDAFSGSVTIVVDGARLVKASAEVHVNHSTARAQTEAATVADAVDLLHDTLRDRIQVLGRGGEEGGNDASSSR
jgi:ribosome-associated translation inhibitor RaiA